jgi:osmotically inducible lipoprotein OsmB
MRRAILITAASVSFLALAACGSSTGDRALSGAGIGGGVGLVGGALLGSPVTGAVLGGAVGAGAGALTDQKDIDLGDPLWE